ncbi:hypothetical protein CEXT_780331 [Caerostris extrusa]|uniref:Uncharacterized protein n=1 Tax=Caerostris extrusa TaxID=172846 RepID=A0AAV4RFX6_CAEEX|nr:hypothetical protein CEXT_780331 [Caerostris extrusa]
MSSGIKNDSWQLSQETLTSQRKRSRQMDRTCWKNVFFFQEWVCVTVYQVHLTDDDMHCFGRCLKIIRRNSRIDNACYQNET